MGNGGSLLQAIDRGKQFSTYLEVLFLVSLIFLVYSDFAFPYCHFFSVLFRSNTSDRIEDRIISAVCIDQTIIDRMSNLRPAN